MVLDLVLILITLLALLIASYTDLKTREVPDWLNYGLIFTAFGIRIIFSFQLGWNIFFEGLLGFVIFFLLAFLFYYTHQWGGGDSKLLMGIGTVIGISLPLEFASLKLLWFFFSLLFLGSIYGLLWMVVVAIKQSDYFHSELKKKIFREKKKQLFIFSFALVFTILGILLHPFWFLVLFPIMVYYLLIFVTAVEKKCFVSKIKVSQLMEGDWLAEKVVRNDKVIMKKKTLNQKDIAELNCKHINLVAIKVGIPFIPSFLFAYLLVTFGLEIFNIILRLFY